MYTSMYEQYYFKNTPIKRVKPIKKVKKKKKSIVSKFLTVIFFALLLFYVFPYSLKCYTENMFPVMVKAPLHVNYLQLLHPAHHYLYKDLFLGKYALENPVYKNFLMVNIQESYERQNLKNRLIQLANEYPKIVPAIYVWEYSGKSYVNINADAAYPAASTIKVPVLIEMFRNIEHGKFSLDDTMVFEDYYRAPGSGKLQYSEVHIL